MERDLQNTRAAITSRRSFNPLPPPPPSVTFSFSSNVSDIIRFFARKIHLSDVSFPSSTFDRRPRLISRLKNGQRKTSRTSKTKDTQVAHRFGIIKTGKREEGVCFMV